MIHSYPCPCCGLLVFDEPPGSFAICPVCFWEDDALQLEFATTLGGGANRFSLLQSQANFRRIGACEPERLGNVRPPAPDEVRDATWRPIDLTRDSFEDWSAESRRRAPADADLYYWRPTFWRAGE